MREQSSTQTEATAHVATQTMFQMLRHNLAQNVLLAEVLRRHAHTRFAAARGEAHGE